MNDTDERLASMERGVIARLLADPSLAPLCRDLPDLVVTERHIGHAGVMTSFEAAPLFLPGVCLRWGQVLGRVNGAVDVDFVVYLDDGRLCAIECATFGDELLPSRIESFELRRR